MAYTYIVNADGFGTATEVVYDETPYTVGETAFTDFINLEENETGKIFTGIYEPESGKITNKGLWDITSEIFTGDEPTTTTVTINNLFENSGSVNLDSVTFNAGTKFKNSGTVTVKGNSVVTGTFSALNDTNGTIKFVASKNTITGANITGTNNILFATSASTGVISINNSTLKGSSVTNNDKVTFTGSTIKAATANLAATSSAYFRVAGISTIDFTKADGSIILMNGATLSGSTIGGTVTDGGVFGIETFNTGVTASFTGTNDLDATITNKGIMNIGGTLKNASIVNNGNKNNPAVGILSIAEANLVGIKSLSSTRGRVTIKDSTVAVHSISGDNGAEFTVTASDLTADSVSLLASSCKFNVSGASKLNITSLSGTINVLDGATLTSSEIATGSVVFNAAAEAPNTGITLKGANSIANITNNGALAIDEIAAVGEPNDPDYVPAVAGNLTATSITNNADADILVKANAAINATGITNAGTITVNNGGLVNAAIANAGGTVNVEADGNLLGSVTGGAVALAGIVGGTEGAADLVIKNATTSIAKNTILKNLTFDGGTVNGGGVWYYVNGGEVKLTNNAVLSVWDLNSSANNGIITIDALSKMNVGGTLSSITVNFAQALPQGAVLPEGDKILLVEGNIANTVTLKVDGTAVTGNTKAVTVGGKSYTLVKESNSIYLTTQTQDTLYVNSAWAAYTAGQEIEISEGVKATFGFNAFNSFYDALVVAKDLNVTGEGKKTTIKLLSDTATTAKFPETTIDNHDYQHDDVFYPSTMIKGNILVTADSAKQLNFTIDAASCDLCLSPEGTLTFDSNVTVNMLDKAGVWFNFATPANGSVVLNSNVNAVRGVFFRGEADVNGLVTSTNDFIVDTRSLEKVVDVDGDGITNLSSENNQITVGNELLFRSGTLETSKTFVSAKYFSFDDSNLPTWTLAQNPADPDHTPAAPDTIDFKLVSDETTWTISDDLFFKFHQLHTADSKAVFDFTDSTLSVGKNVYLSGETLIPDMVAKYEYGTKPDYDRNRYGYKAGEAVDDRAIPTMTINLTNSDMTVGGKVENAGFINVNADSTLDVTGDITNYADAEINVNAFATDDKNVTTYGDASVTATGTVTNSGTITLTGAKDGELTYAASLTANIIANQAGGTINAYNGAVIASTQASTFDNYGTIQVGKADGSDALASTLSFANRGRNYGTINFVASTLTGNGWLDNINLLTAKNSTIGDQISSNFGTIKAENTTFNGPIANSASTNGQKGTFVLLTTDGESAITGNITTDAGTSFRINQAADKTTAEQTLSTDATKTTITGSITNAGEFKADYAKITGNIVNSDSGTFELANSSVSGGSVSTTGTKFELSGSNTLNITDLSGTITLDGGSLTGTIANEITTNAAGALSVNAETTATLNGLTAASTAIENNGVINATGDIKAGSITKVGTINLANLATLTVTGDVAATTGTESIAITVGDGFPAAGKNLITVGSGLDDVTITINGEKAVNGGTVGAYTIALSDTTLSLVTKQSTATLFVNKDYTAASAGGYVFGYNAFDNLGSAAAGIAKDTTKIEVASSQKVEVTANKDLTITPVQIVAKAGLTAEPEVEIAFTGNDKGLYLQAGVSISDVNITTTKVNGDDWTGTVYVNKADKPTGGVTLAGDITAAGHIYFNSSATVTGDLKTTGDGQILLRSGKAADGLVTMTGSKISGKWIVLISGETQITNSTVTINALGYDNYDAANDAAPVLVSNNSTWTITEYVDLAHTVSTEDPVAATYSFAGSKVTVAGNVDLGSFITMNVSGKVLDNNKKAITNFTAANITNAGLLSVTGAAMIEATGTITNTGKEIKENALTKGISLNNAKLTASTLNNQGRIEATDSTITTASISDVAAGEIVLDKSTLKVTGSWQSINGKVEAKNGSTLDGSFDILGEAVINASIIKGSVDTHNSAFSIVGASTLDFNLYETANLVKANLTDAKVGGTGTLAIAAKVGDTTENNFASFSGKNSIANIDNKGILTVNALADDICLTVTGDFTNSGTIVINASALTITDTATQVISISGLVGIDVANIEVISEQAGVVAMVKNDATTLADNGIYLCTVDPTVKTDTIFVNDDWASLVMNQKFTFAGMELVFGVNAFASATSLKITADTKVVNFIADSGNITVNYGDLNLNLTNDTTINVLGAVGQTLTNGTAKFETVSINGNGKKFTANSNIIVEDNDLTTAVEGNMSLANTVFTADGKAVTAESTFVDADAVLNAKSATKSVALGTTTGTGTIKSDVKTALSFTGFQGTTDIDVTDLEQGNLWIDTVIGAGGEFTVSGKNVKNDLVYETPYTKYFTYVTSGETAGLHQVEGACNAITVTTGSPADIREAVDHKWTVGEAKYFSDNVYIKGTSDTVYLQGNSNEYGDQVVTLQSAAGNATTYKAVYGGKEIVIGTTPADLGGDINLTIDGGRYTQYVIGGDRLNVKGVTTGRPQYYRDADINLTINGGIFEKAVAAGSLFQNYYAKASIEVDNTSLTITGGQFASHVYGGHYATSNDSSKKTTIYGTSTVKIVAGKNITVNGTLFVGSIGNGIIEGGTNLILTGSNVDEAGNQTSELHFGDIWGGSADDKVYIEDTGNRVFTGGVEGSRTLTFTGFTGILDSKNVHGFSNVVVEDSVATLKDTVTLVDVNEWEIKAGSTLNGAFKSDFTGDSLALTKIGDYFDAVNAGVTDPTKLVNTWTVFNEALNFTGFDAFGTDKETGLSLLTFDGVAATSYDKDKNTWYAGETYSLTINNDSQMVLTKLA